MGPVAAPVRRLAAYGVDCFVIAAYAVILWVAATGLGAGQGGAWDRAFMDPFTGQLLSVVVLTLPAILYLSLCESSRVGATAGKRWLRIRVVDSSGGRLSLGRAFLRAVVKLAPWELAHGALRHVPGWPGAVEDVPWSVLFAFGITWLLTLAYVALLWWDVEGRTPYDRIAGSWVVTGRVKVAPSEASA